jgi:hypothetical protein
VLGLQEPETYTPTVIPSLRARIGELPQRRRGAFRETLKRLIGKASAPPAASSTGAARPPKAVDPVLAPAPEVQAVLNRACALCQGFCCGNGGNHAYLTVETIARYMAQHPDQRPDDVVAAYLGQVADETVEGSCIFHQRGGCGLPREMRSDTCNRFFCASLKAFQQGLTGRDPARGFFAATEGGTILAAVFCDANESRPVPLSPVPGDSSDLTSGAVSE